MEINIIKRDGSKEPINYEKINKVLLWAVENINGVSASNVAMNAQLQFYNGIKSSDIHKLLIQSAVELVSETEPNYQYVASNLLNYYIRKNIFNTSADMPHIKVILNNNVSKGIYDVVLLNSYNDDELEKINSFVKHERDFNFTWAGLQQMVDKYLLKDRLSGEIYETPQYAYIFIAMTLFAEYKGDRISLIKGFYNQISKWKISLPTPIMCGVRTPNRQYSSCFPAGQKVTTIHGMVNIEDVKDHELVLTHNNRYRKVIATANKNYSGNLVSIDTYNTIKGRFTSTEEHEIFTIKSEQTKCIRELASCLVTQNKDSNCLKKKNDYKSDCVNLNVNFNDITPEWIEAKDIKLGDWIKIPYNTQEENVKYLKISEIIELPKNYVVVDDKIYKQTTDKRKRSGEFNDKIKPLNNIIKLNSEFFRFIGYYLAEGHSLLDTIGLTFNINEDFYINDTKSLIKNIFGYDAFTYTNNNDNSTRVSAFSQVIPLFLNKLCGKGFDKKFLSDVIMNSSSQLQRELLIGIFRGDGFSYPQGLGLALTNHNLIYQINEICLRNKLTPSITRVKTKKTSKEAYRIDLSRTNDYDFFLEVGKNLEKITESKRNTYSNGKWIGNTYFSKVKNVEINEVEDIVVYDLQIEDDKSFVVNGLAVHNCTLIDCGDSLESIYSTNTAIGYYTAKRAGIGINIGRIRAIGAPIRGGEVVHTGVIPFLKMFESTTRSCTQNGVRGGSSTSYIPFWHKEIEDVLVLKNNKGTDDNRVRKMDYGIQFSKLFYKRFINNETITLFSPHEVKDLYAAFGYNDIFDELYVKYENDNTITKKVISARDLFNQFCQERIGTGRIYLMNIDNVNEHSAFSDKVYMSNLCVEIDLPTSPLNHIDDGKTVNKLIKIKTNDVEKFVNLKNSVNALYIDGKTNDVHKNTVSAFDDMFTIIDAYDSEMNKDGQYTILPQKFEMMWGDEPAEIALCVLSAINLGTIKELSELEEVCEFSLRALDFVITHQDYPVEAAKKMLSRRSVGVGITNLAYYFAKNGVAYGSSESLTLLDETMEYIQYYLIKASVKLAKEFGKCDFFHRTNYSKGILPIDTYCKKVDTIVSREKTLDWEALRADVLEFGMRNSTLTAMMPCESSSVISNSTNGIEPPRSLITSKKSKQGIIKMAVPEIYKLKNKYKLAFDVTNKEYSNVHGVIQKWIDQGISGNHYYSMENGDSLSITEVIKDLLYFYNMGGKQLYYSNTADGKTDDVNKMMKDDVKIVTKEAEIEEVEDCLGGACSI